MTAPSRAPMVLFGLTVLTLVLVQVVSLGARNPFTDTLSSYAWVDEGWMFVLALLILAVGILLLASELHRRGRGGPAARTLLRIAAVASVVAAVCPADAPGSNGPSVTGEVHRYASLVLIGGAPAGVLLLASTGMFARRARRILMQVFVIGSLAAVIFVGSLAGDWVSGGVSQRILVGAVVTVLGITALALHQPESVARPDAAEATVPTALARQYTPTGPVVPPGSASGLTSAAALHDGTAHPVQDLL
ncbi:DUF998 domain-containing protein [Nakamurella sp. YIM 132087]|uniref:DUF998 domain-containing protein n=1 Tax=Nakamurella alba TaxID=2665158 RepID=A0A7K1FM67_9ACTN|nr:DUF998 domain-containing protein [Nakamurella alba]MTD13974.1 DUF998 domain-containing protein [Nakamurella alba]